MKDGIKITDKNSESNLLLNLFWSLYLMLLDWFLFLLKTDEKENVFLLYTDNIMLKLPCIIIKYGKYSE